MRYLFYVCLLVFNTNYLSAQEIQSQSRIDEIVVTAEFNDIDAYSISSSISVIGENDISKRNANHLEDLLFIAPNVNYSSGASRGKFYQIRGIGERSEFTEPVNYSVGVIIDGIDFTGIALGASTFDVKQVEILRGPQGTLYGANALAGLINIVSNDPTEDFYSEISGSISEFGGKDFGIIISNSNENNFGYRLGFKNSKSDGFVKNVFLNRNDTNDIDETISRAKFTKNNDTTKLTLNIFYADIDNGYDAFSLDNNRNTYSDEPGYDRQKTTAASTIFEKTLRNNNTIEILASFSDSELGYAYDEDWSNTGICEKTPCDSTLFGFDWWYSSFDSFNRDNTNHSIDLRYISNSENVNWVVGLYNRDQDINLIRKYTYLQNDFKSSFDTRNSAIYGQFTNNFTNKIKFQAGLRYEDRRADYLDNNGPVPEGFVCIEVYPRPDSCLFDNNYSKSENFWGGQISLQNQITENTMIYVLLSRGYKPGGVNIDGQISQQNLNYDSETMWNYELGVKTNNQNKTIFLQASVFYQDRDDVQTKQSLVTSIDSGIVGGDCPCSFADYIGNAASGSNYGLELEFLWILNNKIEIFSTLGLLETEFKNFISYSHINADPENGRGFDLSGREQSHAPKYQFNLSLNYNLSENLFFNLNLEAKDEFYFSDRHDSKSKSYNLLNFVVSYKKNSYEINFYGKNITDEDYQTRGFGSFGNDPRKFYITEQYNQYAAPRVFGINGKRFF